MMDIIIAGMVIIAECASTAGSAADDQLANAPLFNPATPSHQSYMLPHSPGQKPFLPSPTNTTPRSQAMEERSKLTNAHNDQPTRDELPKV